MKELFLDVCFPVLDCLFLRHSIEFFTNVQVAKNGFETRMILSEQGRSKFLLEETVLSDQNVCQIYEFFKIVKGRGFSFRFFDELDNKAEDQSLLEAFGKLFLIKKYEFGNYSSIKRISKPVKDKLLLHYLGNILKEGEDYDVIWDTGEVIINNQNIDKGAVRASFTFDLEVRFENDELLICRDNFGNLYIKNLILVEVLR